MFLALPVRAELTAADIVILANSRMPESVEVAEHYAERRGIDPARICAVPMPTGEKMSFAEYHNDIAPAVREWFRANGLEESADWVVAVYGVPLRVHDRKAADTDTQEREDIRVLTGEIKARLEAAVALAEEIAGIDDGRGVSIDQLRQRLNAAALIIRQDPERQPRWPELQRSLAAPVVPEGWEVPTLPTDPQGTINALAARPADPDARKQLRDLLRAGGPLTLDPLLRIHGIALQTKETGAEFTSELACLWWGNYPKQRWQANPHAYNFGGEGPRTLKTARLDGDSPEQAKRLVDMAVAVESVGLRGKIVIDSRGIPAQRNGKVDNYGIYDETLRLLDLALRDKPNVIFDEQDGVIPAGTHDGVAAYVGWYSVRKYVPGMSFLPGAVGYHIASFEMLSLRTDTFTGWVPNLLDAGVITTLGPVAEPYLASFPKAHDFMLLTLTGELTMGEVYWKTNPMVSWQVGLVGDPLYKPFALAPVLSADELPAHLQPVLSR